MTGQSCSRGCTVSLLPWLPAPKAEAQHPQLGLASLESDLGLVRKEVFPFTDNRKFMFFKKKFCCCIIVVPIHLPPPTALLSVALPAPSPSHSQSPPCCPCPWATRSCSLTGPFPFFPHPLQSLSVYSLFPCLGSVLLVCLFCVLINTLTLFVPVFLVRGGEQLLEGGLGIQCLEGRVRT